MRRPMQEALYEKADAGENLSDRRCRSLPIRHPFRTLSYKSLYQTAASEDTLSDSRCRTLSIRQQMQDSLYQTLDAGVSVSISDSRCKKTNNGCRFLSFE